MTTPQQRKTNHRWGNIKIGHMAWRHMYTNDVINMIGKQQCPKTWIRHKNKDLSLIYLW
jgi:hypothetical protein